MYTELAEKVMRGINFMLLTLSILLNFVFLIIICYIYMDIQARMVYDIDKIRNQYIQDAAYYYMQGCTEGANDYPQERRERFAQGEFGASATLWCDAMKKERNFDEEIGNTLEYLGKNVKPNRPMY